MKRFTSIFMVVLILITSGFAGSAPVKAASDSKPSVKAHAYMVMDANSGKKLYANKASTKIYPASTVKIMTAVVALDQMKLTKKITFSKAMRKQVNSSDIAHLGLKVGAQYTVKDYLHMMLLCSDADSAVALAIGACKSTKTFVNKMNQKAELLGLKSTSFDNPIGLDKGNGYPKTYTTAADFSILARYAMSYGTIRTIVAKSRYKVPKTSKSKAFTIRNTNAFYSSVDYDKTLYRIIGLKTGSTKAAGHVLIAVAKDSNGHEVICSFFGKSTDSRKYKDIKNLLSYTFSQYKKGNIQLSKGFWDTRFRNTEQLIQKYADAGALTGKNGRFYPTQKISQKDFVSIMNAIAGTQLTSSSKEVMTIQNLAELLSQIYSEEITQETVDGWMQQLTHTPEDAVQQKQLAQLYEHGIVTTKLTNDATHRITKEEAVVIADAMKKWFIQ